VVIKGSNRGGPAKLAEHLQKDENERVTVIATAGLLAQDIDGALMELDAMGAALRTSKTLYHASINPSPGERELTDAEHDTARAAFLKGLGLENQPWIEIEHAKIGKDGVLRTHRHIVASAADLEHMRALNFSHNYRKHEEIARGLERQFGHAKVQGAHVEREGKERPARTPTQAEMREAQRSGIDSKTAKAFVTGLWRTTDSAKATNAALESYGWILARGDKPRADGKPYLMLIDPSGGTHELRRRVEGVKAADIYARMDGIDPASLPSVKEAIARQNARPPAREERAHTFERAAQETAAKARQKGQYAPGADAPAPANTRTQAPEDGPEGQAKPRKDGPEKSASKRPGARPVPTRTEIRTASRAQDGIAFAAALAERGVIIAEVRAGDLDRSARRELEGLRAAKDSGVWMMAEGGVDAFKPEQKDSARHSYENWAREREEEGKSVSSFGDYVDYVQKRQAVRLADLTARVAAMPEPVREEPRGPVLPSDAKIGDLVAINARSQIFSINRRTTGKHRDELRAYLAPIDRAALLSVTDAQAAARELRATERAQQRIDAPTGKAAGEIRMAWMLSRSREELQDALAVRGFSFARASADEAHASKERAEFYRQQQRTPGAFKKAKAELGGQAAPEPVRYAPTVNEGEIVAVNGRGHVYRFDERTTGNFRGEIEKRLAGIDPAALLNIIDTAAAIKEADRAQWAEQQRIDREKARPASFIEEKIIACENRARISGIDAERDGQTVRLYGNAAFAASLDKAGIAVVRVTELDMQVLHLLRQDEERARQVADVNRESYKPHRFDEVQAGGFAAVDRYGNVHALNPHRLGLEGIEARLIDAAKSSGSRSSTSSPQPTTLPSVTEARAMFEIDRQTTAALWQQRRADNQARGAMLSSARDTTRRIHRATAQTKSALRGVIHTSERTFYKSARGGLSAAAAVLGKIADVIGGLFDFLAGPTAPPTLEEAKGQQRVAEERRQEAADYAAQAERNSNLDDLLRQIAKDDAERQRQRRERGDHDQVDRGRERER
jgi:hypothetical protein